MEEATESKGATLPNWSDFLLQKLKSYGEPLNLGGAMAPYFRICYLCNAKYNAYYANLQCILHLTIDELQIIRTI